MWSSKASDTKYTFDNYDLWDLVEYKIIWETTITKGCIATEYPKKPSNWVPPLSPPIGIKGSQKFHFWNNKSYRSLFVSFLSLTSLDEKYIFFSEELLLLILQESGPR